MLSNESVTADEFKNALNEEVFANLESGSLDAQIRYYDAQKGIVKRLLSLTTPSAYDIYQLKRNPKTKHFPGDSKQTCYECLVIRDMELNTTLRILNRLRNRTKLSFDLLHTESTEPTSQASDGIISPSTINITETVIDVGGADESMKDLGTSTSLATGQKEQVSMNDVLSRPVQIAEFPLPLNTDVSQILSVWDLFTLNPTVRAKLRNYAFLRGNLKVRISISGTPFHYGRLQVSYHPYAVKNSVLIAYNSGPASLRPCLLNYLSQSKGCTAMNVSDNQPLVMELPFISTKQMHRLFNVQETAISDVTSFTDLENAGDLYLYTLNNVQSTSTNPSEVFVQVYAWMDNVELGAPTGTVLEISTEADETEKGPVEVFSSAAAEISRQLEKIPIISPWAKPSTYIFEGISTLSSHYGWSKPPVLNYADRVKNEPYVNGAQLIAHETTKKISLDPKQELCVDPRIIGIEEDEMSIIAISSRESLLTTFSWSTTDNPLSTSLFTMRINPTLVTTVQTGPTSVIHQPTALSFAAAPFRYWRGDIIVRFEIVCSQYHRGKFAVYFEPNGHQSTLINADKTLNKQYMKIIDIQETQSVEFCVKWASPRPWNKVIQIGFEDTVYGPNVNLGATAGGFFNGFVTVVPFTALQAPETAGNAISVNTYVRCENLQVNFTDTSSMPTRRNISTESGYYGTTQRAPTNSTHTVSCMDLNLSSANSDNICDHYFGEQPLSFRSLLKRYVTTHTESVPDREAIGYSKHISVENVIPFVSPNINGSFSSDTPDLFSYLRYAYMGLKGGIRKRFRYVANFPIAKQASVKVSLVSPTSSNTPVDGFSSPNAISKLKGTVSFIPDTNGGIEFEIPYYSINLFSFSFNDNFVGANGADDMEKEWIRLYEVETDLIGNITDGRTMEESAAAEDFSFLRFEGAPFYSIS